MKLYKRGSQFFKAGVPSKILLTAFPRKVCVESRAVVMAALRLLYELLQQQRLRSEKLLKRSIPSRPAFHHWSNYKWVAPTIALLTPIKILDLLQAGKY